MALKSASFSLADVQSDVLSPSRMHTTAFSIDQLLCRRFFDMLGHVSMRRCIKSLVTAAGVADVVCTMYNQCTFLHKSTNSVVNSTGLFGGHRSGELKSGVSC